MYSNMQEVIAQYSDKETRTAGSTEVKWEDMDDGFDSGDLYHLLSDMRKAPKTVGTIMDSWANDGMRCFYIEKRVSKEEAAQLIVDQELFESMSSVDDVEFGSFKNL